MECSINIGHFTVNSLSNNANINFEATLQNSHTANSKFCGGCFNFGDNSSFSCTQTNQCPPDGTDGNEDN